ncbi:MAG: type II secretion system protein GspG [Phycisphaerae bacterium]|nr:type II secretion system protein GspG [Phycisphaerae bacterium]
MSRRTGFTLVEVLIVVAILVMLAAGATVAYRNIYKGAQIETAMSRVGEVRSAVELFHLKIGRYPSKDKGLQELLTAPDDEGEAAIWKNYGPFLKDGKITTDPWGTEIQYELTEGDNGEEKFRVFSCGPNRRAGDEDDIPQAEGNN